MNQGCGVADQDITNLIERLEAFEDRLGVSLEGLFAVVDTSGYVRVNGELHLREGTELNQDIEVVATVYDSSGRVIAASDHTFREDSFFAFEVFTFFMDVSGHPPTKVRVYPKIR